MNVTPENAPASQSAQPPRLMPSFIAGFNTVASNIYLILLPVLLDLLLWFGPHLRLKELMLPFVLDSIAAVREMNNSGTNVEMLAGIEQIWTSFLEHYNVLSMLNTFPVGVPSLMAGQGPLNTPFGSAPVMEISGVLAALGLWLLAGIIGLVLGSLYFATIAHYSVPLPANAPLPASSALGQNRVQPRVEPAQTPSAPLSLHRLGWQVLQVILLIIILFALLMILFLPAMFITSILTLLSPALATIALVGMSFIVLWLLIPLVFSPHGIFVLSLNALSAMLASARLVRFFLPGTGLFLLMTVIFYQGLGILWRTPPDTSWMALVGIFGHAFISTALLSASFFYYRSGHEFVLSLRKSMNSA